jgi:hypothetical protein
MARARRLYVPLDVGFFDDARIIRAGERAAVMYLKMLVLVKTREADGILESEHLARLHLADWRKRLVRLLDEGLVLEMEDGRYLIPSWSKWNELSHQRAERLARDRDRKRGPLPPGIRSESTGNPRYRQSGSQSSTPTPPPVGEVIATQNLKVKGETA